MFQEEVKCYNAYNLKKKNTELKNLQINLLVLFWKKWQKVV